jgi:hypothetical protein
LHKQPIDQLLIILSSTVLTELAEVLWGCKKMSERIMIFRLPEEQDEFTLAHFGYDFWVVLFELDQWLRSKIKYEGVEEYQLVRDELYNLMEAHHVSLDMVS